MQPTKPTRKKTAAPVSAGPKKPESPERKRRVGERGPGKGPRAKETKPRPKKHPSERAVRKVKKSATPGPAGKSAIASIDKTKVIPEKLGQIHARGEKFPKGHVDLPHDLPTPGIDDFSPEVSARVCSVIEAGYTITEMARMPGMPSDNTMYRWMVRHPEFYDAYQKAKVAQAERMSADILRISDDGFNDTYIDDKGQRQNIPDVLGRSKLRVDTRRWLMSKFAPKRFGDKVVQQHQGPGGGPVQIADTAALAKLTDAELAQAILIAEKLAAGSAQAPEDDDE